MRNNNSKIALFVIAACLVSLLAACQPTPEREAVVGKGNGALEDKVLSESSEKELPQAGDRIVWNETRNVNIDIDNMGDYTVIVNMDAQMPEIPKRVPIYLIEPQELSIDFMKKASQYLMKGEILDGKETKEDVEKEILTFKKDTSAHTILEGYQKNIDDELEWLNKKYSDAPESNSEAKYEYIEDKHGGDEYFTLKSYPNDSSIMVFSANTDGFYFYINEFTKMLNYLSNTTGEDIQATGTKMTYQEALATANKTMDTLFEEPFVMAQSRLTDIVNINEYLWNDETETSEGQAYVFYYTREYEGIPSLFIQNAPREGNENKEYAKPYSREGAYVVVDDRGIVKISYDSYSHTVKTLNENVNLMPFDEVLDRFKDGVFYHNLWSLGGSIEIKITRIEFGLVREPIKDNPDQYMMVPAWNFIGDVGNPSWNQYGECEGKSILALSAIDGSIITDYQNMTDPK